MEEVDRWLENLSYGNEDIPGKSYYIYNKNKYTIYGKGDTGKCNTLIEVFYRVNDMEDKIKHNYCSDPNSRSLFEKLKRIISEYSINKFNGSLSKVIEEKERTKIVEMYNAYKSFYSSFLTGMKNIDIKILSDLDDNTLTQVCQASRYVRELCNDYKLWKIKINKLDPSIDIKNVNYYKQLYIENKNRVESLKKIYPSLILPLFIDKETFDTLKNLGFEHQPWSLSIMKSLSKIFAYEKVRWDFPLWDDDGIIHDSTVELVQLNNAEKIWNDPETSDFVFLTSLRVYGDPRYIKDFFVALGFGKNDIQKHIDASINKNNYKTQPYADIYNELNKLK